MRTMLRLIWPVLCLCSLLLTEQPVLANPGPIPEIKINGVDGPLSLTPSDQLTISLSMDCRGVTGMADWWLAAGTPFGFYFLHPDGWDVAARPYMQSGLQNIAPTPLLTLALTSFPQGSYVLYFGVDTNPDGQLNTASLSYDQALFVIGGGLESSMTIGPEGGALQIENHLGDLIQLTIPPGAITTPTMVRLTTLAGAPPNPIARNVFPGVVIQPEGLRLHESASLSLTLADELNSPSTSLLLYVKDGGLVLPIGRQSVSKTTIEGLIHHFSTYTGGQPSGGEAASQAGKASNLPPPADPYGWQDTYDVCDALFEWGEIVERTGGDGQQYIDKAIEAAKRDAANFLEQPVPADPCGDYLDVLFKYADLLMRLTSGSLVSSFQDRINEVTAECADRFRIEYDHSIKAQGISWSYAGTIKLQTRSDEVPAEVRETSPGTSSLSGGGSLADCTVSITGSVTTTLDSGHLTAGMDQAPVLTLVLRDSWTQTATVTCPKFTRSMPLPQTFIHPLTFQYEDGYTITQPAGESGTWRWTLRMAD